MSKRAFVAILCLALVCPALASAQMGQRIYPIYQIPDDELPDVRDGSMADWEGLVPGKPLTEADFTPASDREDNVTDPADLAYSIYLGWSKGEQRLYMAIERLDDVYVNGYEGGNPNSMWRYDGVEFMVDGDHSGGEYNDGSPGSGSQAQQYLALPESPDGQQVALSFRGNGWMSKAPYVDAGGMVEDGTPHRSLIEMAVTPWDRLGATPASSDRSFLQHNRIIGFQISVPDFDVEAGQYNGFHTLSGQPTTWRFAEQFVDGRLVGCVNCGLVISATSAGGRPWRGTLNEAPRRYLAKPAAQSNSWGRIKASSQEGGEE